jgi:Kef-type K+ transport system membrane component KefB
LSVTRTRRSKSTTADHASIRALSGQALDPFVLLAAQLGVLLVAAVALGQLAARLGLPPIVGELVAGVLLGPTVLGRLWPGLTALLFPVADATASARADFLKVGLLLFLLVVGLEIKPELVGARWRTIAPTSLLGLVVPFGVGYLAVVALPELWGAASPALAPTVGIALAISALPVIARIMADLGLLRSEVGRIVIASAVIDDLLGWVGFAALAAAFAGRAAPQPPLETLLIVLAAFAAALLLGRALGASRLVPSTTDAPARPDTAAAGAPGPSSESSLPLAVVLAATLLAAAFMEGIGVHASLGALLVGLTVSGMETSLFDPVRRLVHSFFAPLYFGAVGLGLDLATHFDATLVAAVFLIACLGKLVGASLGARLGGLAWREALAVGAGMNARGAVGLLLASLAREVGLVDDRVFVALIVMALATSLLAGALLPRILRR